MPFTKSSPLPQVTNWPTGEPTNSAIAELTRDLLSGMMPLNSAARRPDITRGVPYLRIAALAVPLFSPLV